MQTLFQNILMIGVVLKEFGQFEGQFGSNFPQKFQIFGITPLKLYQFSFIPKMEFIGLWSRVKCVTLLDERKVMNDSDRAQKQHIIF